jgi:hypothetical protein
MPLTWCMMFKSEIPIFQCDPPIIFIVYFFICSKYLQVSDFGLARLAADSNTHVTTRVMGTFG